VRPRESVTSNPFIADEILKCPLEARSIGSLVLLLGGATYVFVGILTLISATLSYFITEIPFLPKQTLLYNPLPLQWLLIFVIFSIVQFAVAALIIASVRVTPERDAGGKRRRTLLVLATATVGVVVAYLWAVLATAVGNGNPFLFFAYSPITALVPPLGFVLSISGALTINWEARVTDQRA
jgi:hypothetical protein